jgi:hypothetical protein
MDLKNAHFRLTFDAVAGSHENCRLLNNVTMSSDNTSSLFTSTPLLKDFDDRAFSYFETLSHSITNREGVSHFVLPLLSAMS